MNPPLSATPGPGLTKLTIPPINPNPATYNKKTPAIPASFLGVDGTFNLSSVLVGGRGLYRWVPESGDHQKATAEVIGLVRRNVGIVLCLLRYLQLRRTT
jgi:hypothetical protein